MILRLTVTFFKLGGYFHMWNRKKRGLRKMRNKLDDIKRKHIAKRNVIKTRRKYIYVSNVSGDYKGFVF